MVHTAVKFNLIENKKFHLELEKYSNDTEPVDASMGVLFESLTLDTNGKCYYPFFFREPFSLKDIEFCDLIAPDHLQKLKDKEVTPLICMVSEGWPLLNFNSNKIFTNSPYFNVIKQLVKHGIREEDVVWLNCDKYIGKDPRIKAKFIHFDFFLEQQKVLENKFLTLTKIKNKFLSLARGTPKHHRYAITYMLFKNNLFQHGAISCTDYKNFYYTEGLENTNEYISKLDEFNPVSFDQFKNMLPIEIDSKSKIVIPEHNSYQSPINLHQDGRDESHLFTNTFLNLVNESHQQDNLVFITEKTYRSINYCRPFVINGDRGSLKYLKDMGFKTFDKFWDESYDEETSDHVRIKKIIDIVKHITCRTESELLDLFKDMLPTLEHNYKVLKNYEQWNKLN
jgi:hypothetical protein